MPSSTSGRAGSPASPAWSVRTRWQKLWKLLTVIRDAAIVVDGATITYAGPADRRPDDAGPVGRRIDCSGLLITPGLVNSHNHVYEILYRGLGKSCSTEDWLRDLVYPANRTLDAEDFYHGAVLAVAEAFSSGTTALVEQLTNFARHHADAEFRALTECGIRARVARAASTSSVIDPSEEGAPDAEVAAVESFLHRWPREGLVCSRAWDRADSSPATATRWCGANV